MVQDFGSPSLLWKWNRALNWLGQYGNQIQNILFNSIEKSPIYYILYISNNLQVNVVEGANGTCMIRNLSVHLAPSEDVAHALLLQGQANRRVAETPVNQRSSRSHAVFTIYLTAKKQQSDIITRLVFPWSYFASNAFFVFGFWPDIALCCCRMLKSNY